MSPDITSIKEPDDISEYAKLDAHGAFTWITADLPVIGLCATSLSTSSPSSESSSQGRKPPPNGKAMSTSCRNSSARSACATPSVANSCSTRCLPRFHEVIGKTLVTQTSPFHE